jgi:hypothetical protein
MLMVEKVLNPKHTVPMHGVFRSLSDRSETNPANR